MPAQRLDHVGGSRGLAWSPVERERSRCPDGRPAQRVWPREAIWLAEIASHAAAYTTLREVTLAGPIDGRAHGR
jgi:hypothetical protein